MLLEPELEAVRVALEAQEDDQAATALRAVMRGKGRFGNTSPECNYLLGTIEERRGATPGAVAAFEYAAAAQWPLRGDALIHLVRLALRGNQCEVARKHLDSLGARLKDESLAIAELVARIEICESNWADAIEHLQRSVAAGGDSAELAPLRIALAQALLAQANAGQTALELVQQQIVELVRNVLSDSGPESAELDQAKAVLSQLFALPRPFANQLGLSQQRVALLETYVEARQFTEAKVVATELLGLLPDTSEQNQLYCRVTFAMGRSAAGLSDAKAATDAFDWVSQHCEDGDLVARALFLAGGQRAAGKKRTEAIANYAELESRFPNHRLADDARLKQAILYRAMGADSRFVALLDRMPDDYPNGDMVIEGLFQLALKSMVAHQWPTALSVMERSDRLTTLQERAKDQERDRHRYFLARARIASGKLDQGLELLQDLIVRRPLAYYMLHGYSTLTRLRPELASAALKSAVSNQAPPIPQSEVSSWRERQLLERMLLLLGVGDVKAAEVVQRQLGARPTGEAAIASMARMFANTGAPKTAFSLVKRHRLDCRVAWPAGTWTELWKQFYPRPYNQIVQRESTRQAVPASLIYAIMREESEFDPGAISPASAYGLMQLILPTARTAARRVGVVANSRTLLQPSPNITLGTRVLSTLLERFQGEPILVAAGYNAGPGRPIRWLGAYPEVATDLWVELIEYQETRNYVKRVVESYATYRYLYPEKAADSTTLDVIPERLGTDKPN